MPHAIMDGMYKSKKIWGAYKMGAIWVEEGEDGEGVTPKNANSLVAVGHFSMFLDRYSLLPLPPWVW